MRGKKREKREKEELSCETVLNSGGFPVLSGDPTISSEVSHDDVGESG